MRLSGPSWLEHDPFSRPPSRVILWGRPVGPVARCLRFHASDLNYGSTRQRLVIDRRRLRVTRPQPAVNPPVRGGWRGVGSSGDRKRKGKGSRMGWPTARAARDAKRLRAFGPPGPETKHRSVRDYRPPPPPPASVDSQMPPVSCRPPSLDCLPPSKTLNLPSVERQRMNLHLQPVPHEQDIGH